MHKKHSYRHSKKCILYNIINQQLQWDLSPEGGTMPQVIPGSELALTVVPPGANGSLVAAVSF